MVHQSKQLAPRPAAAVASRSEGFSESTESNALELAQNAAVAAARAEVEARFIMAYKSPRNVDECLVRLISECKRPDFAEAAVYAVNRGEGTVRGLSARFAEAAARAYRNLDQQASPVYEDDTRRTIRCSVTDLEANVTRAMTVVIAKTVERKREREGLRTYGRRKNSNGEWLYTIEATEDEVFAKQNSLVSKINRNLVLQLIPADILEQARKTLAETRENKVKKDPQAEKRSLVLAFGELRVMPQDIEAFIGHSLDRVQVSELIELREVYAAIKAGEQTWEEAVAARRVIDVKPEPTPATPPAQEPTQAQPAADTTPATSTPEHHDATPPPAPAKPTNTLGEKFWALARPHMKNKSEATAALLWATGQRTGDPKECSDDEISKALEHLKNPPDAGAKAILDEARAAAPSREPGEEG